MVLSRTVSEIKGNLIYLLNFPTPLYLTPDERVSLEFVMRWRLDKQLKNSDASIYHTLLRNADSLNLNEIY